MDQDSSAAVYWFKKAAVKGDAAAQNNLGLMYLFGYGVDMDVQAALMWCGRSAAQGLAAGQYSLGWIHASGHGVPTDHVLAETWLHFAEAGGDNRAPRMLDALAKIDLAAR